MYRLTEPYVDRALALDALSEVVDSNYYTQGPRVKQFEATWASLIGRGFGVACNSGTTALHLALRALGLEKPLVAVPAYTCVATALPVSYEGYGLSFIDVGTFLNLSHDELEEGLDTVEIGAVIGVHVYGQPFARSIVGLCQSRDVPLIEDCAEAHGAQWDDGKKVGSQGLIACFSFRGDKVLTAGGAGGMCVTDDPALADKMREERDTYLPRPRELRYDATGIGFSYEMTELQAAFALSQLGMLPLSISARRAVYAMYVAALQETPFEVIPHNLEMSAVWRIALRRREPGPKPPRVWRDGFIRRVNERDVEVLPGFTSLTLKPYGWASGSCPKAESLGSVFCVPCHPRLTETDVVYIVKTLVECYE